jgi:hypothetical protein
MAVTGLGSGSTYFLSGGVCATLVLADPIMGAGGAADAEDASTGTAISPTPPPTRAFRSRVLRLTPLPVGFTPARGEPCE